MMELAPPSGADRRLDGPAAAPALELGQVFHPGEKGAGPSRADNGRAMLPPPPLRSTSEPLTADLRRLHVTVSRRFLEKLDAAKDALSHSHPGGDVEAILEAGLDLLIERAAARKGLVKRPRAAAPTGEGDDADPRRVTAAVRREVWLRDEGRCRWPTADGGICGSTHRLELDHVLPVARGGRPTVANLRVLCDFHNDLAARAAYGDTWMDRFTGRSAGVRCGGGEVPVVAPARP